MVERRDVFATRDEALDTLGNGRYMVSLRYKESLGMWCLTWLEDIQA